MGHRRRAATSAAAIENDWLITRSPASLHRVSEVAHNAMPAWLGVSRYSSVVLLPVIGLRRRATTVEYKWCRLESRSAFLLPDEYSPHFARLEQKQLLAETRIDQ